MKKDIKIWVQIGVAFLLAFLVMCVRGLFTKTELSDIIMAIGDGFTVAAFLYLGMGALVWVSTTGMFDIFGFAVKRGAHAIIPGLFTADAGGYYEYKVKKAEKRKGFTEHFTLKIGFVFLIISLILTFVWYRVV